VFVFGARIHEVMLGASILCACSLLWLAGIAGPPPVIALGLCGLWLVAKDWRDLFPSLRDTAGWRLGLHRRFTPLRPRRPGDATASLAAFLTFVSAIVNIVSALTPNVGWRTKLLVQLEPVSLLPALHALALPAGVALGAIAVNLARRRRRALYGAVLILAIVGMLDLLKGLDVEETLLSWSVAGMLWWRRDIFHVGHARLDVRGLLRAPLILMLGVTAATVAAVWASTPNVDLAFALHNTVDVLAWQAVPGGGGVSSLLALVVRSVGMIGLTVAIIAFFKPLTIARHAPDPVTRRDAHELVRAYGTDTLAYFKLRQDTEHFFSSDKRAFLAYRVENGVLLVSGDPVGHPAAFPGLVRDVCAFADLRGLKVGAVGVGRELLPLYEHAGLQSLYIGDEAIVETHAFTLEGRGIRKVRQSVNRLESAGYSVTLHRGGELDDETTDALERISTAWRGAAPERGFSMAMDSPGGERQPDTIVVVAHDASGVARGFLHFVPTYGRNAVSLSHMRRDPETPNGLTEFLVVRAISILREQGIQEMSLNFSAFARLLHNPSGIVERVLGRALALANPFFQIESLYRFNVKFGPRWEPRYLLHEGGLNLPRVGLAVLRAEGQLPRLRDAAIRT
jgi:lysyl-tRNA synthetase, class II